MAGFLVDRSIRDSLERNSSLYKAELELIASEADSNVESLLGEQLGFSDNIVVASNVLLTNIENFVRFEDAQIRELRNFSYGATDQLVKKDSVVPASIAADTLAVLGGAVYNPATSEVFRDGEGTYSVGGLASVGLLYGSRRVLDVFSDQYVSQYGELPSIKYKWLHFTPRPRALEAHYHLDGVTFTAETAPEVLRNDSVPWLGPYFVPRQNLGCRCLIVPTL